MARVADRPAGERRVGSRFGLQELRTDAPNRLREMTDRDSASTRHVVALFNANDDTVVMVKGMLRAAGHDCLAVGRVADLKRGLVDFTHFLDRQDPDVVIFDVSPPYAENWKFFVTLRDNPAMAGRGLVVTTTNKQRLDEEVGGDSEALELVGKPYDLNQIQDAIAVAMAGARHTRAPRT